MAQNVQAERIYRVYCLKEPDTLIIRYIGLTMKSLSYRLKLHLRDKRNCSYKSNWIESLRCRNLVPLIEIIEDGLTLEEAKIKEIELIKFYRENNSKSLVNMTNGGDAIMAGRKHKPESINKIKMALRGANNPFYGKRPSDDFIQKLIERTKGKPSKLKGKELTQEHKEKLRKPKSKKRKSKTRFDLQLIRKMREDGVSQTYIARLFNTDQGTISRIINKINYT